jgi:NADPH:quinone reductase-like Zn-dependent oxidoreductase
MTGKIFNAMPERSTVIIYGVLSYAPCNGIDGGELIFGQKHIKGFWLTDWVRKAGLLKIFQASRQIQRRITDGSFKTKVRQQLKLEDVPKGLMEYQKQMTAGKILILPNHF